LNLWFGRLKLVIHLVLSFEFGAINKVLNFPCFGKGVLYINVKFINYYYISI